MDRGIRNIIKMYDIDIIFVVRAQKAGLWHDMKFYWERLLGEIFRVIVRFFPDVCVFHLGSKIPLFQPPQLHCINRFKREGSNASEHMLIMCLVRLHVQMCSSAFLCQNKEIWPNFCYYHI